jgi:DNA-binding IclR family transcriptional regulator
VSDVASGGMQAISRAASILRALDGEHDGLSLSDLSARAGLPRSTVHRLVTALQAEGFVAPVSPNGRTRLGPELVRLAMSTRQGLRKDFRPYMEELFRQLDETIDLSVLEGDRVRFIDQITADHPLRAVSGVGKLFPLHCSANGRILLAELPVEQRRELLRGKLESCTQNTVTDRAKVLEAVEQATTDGVAITREEITEGLCAAAVALHDPFGGVAAISVVAPTIRFNRSEDEIVGALRDVKRKASGA